jgi:Family of unknown function (DUF6011)
MSTLDNVFERLRALAEADTVNKGTENRRPSWGPALTVESELDALLDTLGYWQADDKKVLRLWALFADPKKVGTLLRTDVGKLPMPEARCRAFELRVGTDRAGAYVLRVKRWSDGRWDISRGQRTGFPANNERWNVHRELVNKRSELTWCERRYAEQPDLFGSAAHENVLHECRRKIAALEERQAALQAAKEVHHKQCERLHELACQRVAEFAGDPFPQMVAGAHVTGNCAICGRLLTDPTSIERGIGPECYGHVAPALRAYVERRERAA